LVLERRPSLKANSAKTYAISLNSIAPNGVTEPSWIYDVSTVLQQLEKYKETTRKNVLNALIVVVGAENNKDVFDKYTKERDKYNAHYSDLSKAGKKTASQEKNWIDWPDYLKLVTKMKGDINDLKGKDWSWREKQRYQDYLIVLLYSHYPLRNDFANVKLTTATALKKATDIKEQNYLIKKGKNYEFILNEYKTSRAYGEKRITLNVESSSAITKWLIHNKTGYLLIDKQGRPIGSNGITKALTRIGEREVSRKLGSSLLRHSYLTHKYKDTQSEKQKDADLMGHSVSMQEDYIKQ
jgi:integrase